MTDSVHKKIEIVGTSGESLERAIEIALAKASATVRGLEWFEVDEIRGRVVGDRVDQYQVTLRVGFKLDD